MMNGAKKSDSSIVPAKLANKAERSAAESVEGDDGTKRNAELQSTVRTQSRDTVTHAQARIRGAVTRNKKEKLTALLHHVSIDVLRWAFFNLKKRAAPGADGLTWTDYAANLDRTSLICTQGSTQERIEHCHHVANTYPRRMANNGRSALLPWKTKSSRQRWLRSSRRSTRRSSWGSATGSDLGAASTMRWMRSHTESTHAKSTGFLTPIYRGSSIL